MIERDDSIFCGIFKKYYYVLFTYAYSITGDRELTEEIVQDTFLVAWNKYADFLLSPNPGGWLMNVTKFNIKNTLRKKRSFLNQELPLDDVICLPDTGQQSDPLANGEELLEIISRYVSQSEVSLLKKTLIEGYTCAEIANELGMKANTCQKKLQRLLKKIQKIREIQEYFEGKI